MSQIGGTLECGEGGGHSVTPLAIAMQNEHNVGMCLAVDESVGRGAL